MALNEGCFVWVLEPMDSQWGNFCHRAALGVLVYLKRGTWEQLAPLFDECLEILITADPDNTELVWTLILVNPRDLCG